MQKNFQIEWDISQLGDDNTFLSLVKFPDWENTHGLRTRFANYLPDEIYFEGNMKKLAVIDYPKNDMAWPIVSTKMIEILRDLGQAAFKTKEISVIDDSVGRTKWLNEDGSYREQVLNKKFSALLIDELDLIDRENSELDATNPKIIKSIKKLILLMPDNNFPAIFRVQGLLAKTFVPESTKQIFEKNNIQGLLYKNIEDLKT